MVFRCEVLQILARDRADVEVSRKATELVLRETERVHKLLNKQKIQVDTLLDNMLQGVATPGYGKFIESQQYYGNQIKYEYDPDKAKTLLKEAGCVPCAFTVGISLLSGLLVGLFAARRYGRPDLIPALKEGGRGGTVGRGRLIARNALVVVQMALSLVLLVGAGLMVLITDPICSCCLLATWAETKMPRWPMLSWSV